MFAKGEETGDESIDELLTTLEMPELSDGPDEELGGGVEEELVGGPEEGADDDKPLDVSAEEVSDEMPEEINDEVPEEISDEVSEEINDDVSNELLVTLLVMLDVSELNDDRVSVKVIESPPCGSLSGISQRSSCGGSGHRASGSSALRTSPRASRAG